MRSPLNRTTAPQAIRLFDYCFKQGVFDACYIENDYEAQQFLDSHPESGGYGLLVEPYEGFDWRHWQHTLYRFCREARIKSIAENYIDCIHRYRKKFVFAILPIAMRFYLMGIEEWLSYPNPNNTEIFKHEGKIHWKPVPRHLRKMSTPDFISLIQQFVYERQSKEYPGDLSATMYDTFANTMWRCVQKYPVYVTDKEDEDI